MTSFLLGAVVRDLRRTGAAGASGFLLSALAVLAIGGTVLSLDALGRLAAARRAEVRIVAILREDAARPDGPRSLLPSTRALPGAGTARYVSSAEALVELRRYLGPAAAGLDRLPANPVPARIEVTPANGVSAATLRALADALGRLPGVEEVQAALAGVEETERVEAALRNGGFGVGIVLALAALAALIGATVVAQQRGTDETAILRLVGAREASIRGPLLLQAGVLGGAGAALGWSVLLAVSEAGLPWIGGSLRAVLGLVALPWPGWPLGVTLVGGGAAAGLLAGWGAGRP